MFGWLVKSLRLVSVLLSTSREVRHSMKSWVLSQEGDQWSVRFDVWDLGGHLDTTFRGWSSTLAARVRLVISRLVLIFALPLDFHGRVSVVRSMYLPAALHGIEASLLASDSLRKLRPSIRKVVWSRRQPLANIGAVLSLLDGPTGCDPEVSNTMQSARDKNGPDNPEASHESPTGEQRQEPTEK